MASKRQIEANRSNAGRSTGPRTVEGKARSSRNGLSHGLSCSASNKERGNEGLAAITLLQTALSPDPSALISVKLELSQIRRVRAEILETILESLDVRKLDSLRRLYRYDRAAFARQKRLLRVLSEREA
jgi:hypothetical protein